VEPAELNFETLKKHQNGPFDIPQTFGKHESRAQIKLSQSSLLKKKEKKEN